MVIRSFQVTIRLWRNDGLSQADADMGAGEDWPGIALVVIAIILIQLGKSAGT